MNKKKILFLFLIVLSLGGFSQTFNEILKTTAGVNRQELGHYGFASAMSGNYAAVSAKDENLLGGLVNAGAVYVYEKDDYCGWELTQTLTASDASANDRFGYSIDISGDLMIIGAANEAHGLAGQGAAYIFERNGAGIWIEVQKITASDGWLNDSFGTVAISGTYAAVGAFKHDNDATGGSPMSKEPYTSMKEMDLVYGLKYKK